MSGGSLFPETRHSTVLMMITEDRKKPLLVDEYHSNWDSGSNYPVLNSGKNDNYFEELCKNDGTSHQLSK